MIVNTGIVDKQVAVGGLESHQGRIDCAPGDQCLLLSRPVESLSGAERVGHCGFSLIVSFARGPGR